MALRTGVPADLGTDTEPAPQSPLRTSRLKLYAQEE